MQLRLNDSHLKHKAGEKQQQQQQKPSFFSFNYIPESNQAYCEWSFCVAIMERLNYGGHESKNYSLEFIFLTHMWPWKQGQGHQT